MERALRITILSMLACALLLGSASAAHFITGIVLNSTSDVSPDGMTVYLYITGTPGDNITDTVGPAGASGQANKYLSDCESLSTPCVIGDNITIVVPDNGTHSAGPITFKTTGAGYDQAPNMTLEASNEAPTILLISLDDSNPAPSGEIDLEANTTHKVYCNVSVSDGNGAGNIANVTAVFYDSESASSSSADNSNIHYTNNTCTSVVTAGNVNNFTCAFDVQWFANASTWVCNATATDNSAAQVHDNISTTINQLVSLSIPDILDFGTLTIGSSSTDDVNTTIESYSNIVMDVKVNGTALGGSGCTGSVSSIGVANITYSDSPEIPYSSMTPLGTGQSTVDLNIAKPTTTDSTTDMLHWKVYVPEATNGVCNGTITFTAVAG